MDCAKQNAVKRVKGRNNTTVKARVLIKKFDGEFTLDVTPSLSNVSR